MSGPGLGLGVILVALSCSSLACEPEPTFGDAVLACGESLEPFEACGGELTGLWQLTSSCVTEGDEFTFDAACPITVELGVGGAGHITFEDDDQVSSRASLRQRTRAFVEKSCLPDLLNSETGEVPKHCSDISPPPPLSFCADRGERCLCSGNVVFDQIIPKGSYTTLEPGVLLLGAGTPAERRLEYCVRDRFLDTRTVYTSAIETDLTIVSRWLR